MAEYVVVADIGATNTRLGFMTSKGQLLWPSRFSTQDFADDPSLLISRIADSIASIPTDGIRGIGLSFAGPTDNITGTASLTNLRGWEDPVPVRDLLSHCNLPIFMGNDATLAALAEFRYGVQCENLAYLTLSTGVGGGVILDGKMYTGANGAAAEFGHIQVNHVRAYSRRCGCGRHGCLESEISGTAIVDRAVEKLGIDLGWEMERYLKTHQLNVGGMNAKIVADMATAGIVEASDIWMTAGRYLGKALQVIALAYNPEVIVIGGSVGEKASDLFLPEAVEVFREGFLPNCSARVRVTNLGDQISLLGVCALVEEKLGH